MSGLDDRMGEKSSRSLTTQAETMMRAAFTGRRAIGVALSLSLIVLAGIVAPGDAPGAWAWVRVLLVWLLATTALVRIASAPELLRTGQPVSPLLVWGSLLLAVVISLTFTTLSAVLALLTLILLLLTMHPGRPTQPTAFWSLVVTLTPLWVWSAFDAWDRWLLMLVPIGTVGLVSLEHALRSGLADHGLVERIASWIGIVGLAAILLIAALLGGIDTSWVTAGAIGVTVLGAFDIAVLPDWVRPIVPTFILPALALVWLTYTWLTAL